MPTQGEPFYLLVRGPLGIGKTTVSEWLAERLGAEYISVDRILDDHGLWEEGLLSEFLRANDFVIERVREAKARGRPAIVDGNFYWERQIEELTERLGSRHWIFTLEAPLAVCIERDSQRETPHGPAAARAVYEKTTRFRIGIPIDAAGSTAATVQAILAALSAPRRSTGPTGRAGAPGRGAASGDDPSDPGSRSRSSGPAANRPANRRR